MTYKQRLFDERIAGMPVYTLDGHEIGSVREVRDGYFKVDAPMQPDYWLREEDISAATGGRVTLRFEMQRLDDHRLHHPAGVARPSQEATSAEQAAWERSPGRAAAPSMDDEPAYRYGYEMAHEPRFSGREWHDVEQALGAGYAEWSRRTGYPVDERDTTAWERAKERSRAGWERARGR